MFTEKLSLEVEARRSGLEVVVPPVAIGKSGVEHSFSFMASSGALRYAFDIREKVNEMDVIGTYVKKLDTGVVANMVCTSGMTGETAKKLAGEYGMSVLKESELANFFAGIILKRPNGSVGNGRHSFRS
jgi:hypothetical protein